MTFLAEMDGATGLISPQPGERERGVRAATRIQERFTLPAHRDRQFSASRNSRNVHSPTFPYHPSSGDVTFQSPQERLKTQFNPDGFGPRMRTLFYSFNSKPFISVLENITGIKGLIPDPYFLGGGFHEICQGGHLSVHADFNHHKLMDLERRINVLIYLNKGWQEAWGGQLELWDREHDQMREVGRARDSIAASSSTPPTLAFTATRIPLLILTAFPASPSRSITIRRPGQPIGASTRARFRGRPGLGDGPNFRARRLMARWLPPIVGRTLRRMRNKRSA